MIGWHVGQKIICVDVGPVDGEPAPDHVIQFLKENDIYIIREIVPSFYYRHKKKKEQLLGFRLLGIEAPWGKDSNGGWCEYAFWCGRFRPLIEKKMEVEVKEEAPLPQNLLDDLDQVRKGLIKFDDEFEKEWVKEEKRVKEPAK